MNQEKIKQFIEHDTIIDIYNKNLDNSSLLKKLETIYQSKYNVVLTADNAEKIFNRRKKGNFYIAEDIVSFAKFYLDTTKNVCEEIGINFILNPKDTQNPNNAHIIATNIFNTTYKKDTTALCVLDSQILNSPDNATLNNDLIGLSNDLQSTNNQMILISDKIPEALYFPTNFHCIDVDPTPKASLDKPLDTSKNQEQSQVTISKNSEQSQVTISKNSEQPKVNQEKIKQYIEHDTIIAIYNKNLDNPSLLASLESAYKSKFNFDLTPESLPSILKNSKRTNLYITEDINDFEKFYIETTKQLCKDLGLNFILNPNDTHVYQKNDYVISTDICTSNFKHDVAGFSILDSCLLEEHYSQSRTPLNYSLVTFRDKINGRISHLSENKNQLVLFSDKVPLTSVEFSTQFTCIAVETTPKASLTKESVLQNIKSISKTFSDTSTNDLKLTS